MRILIDECLPRRLTKVLAEHEAKTVPQAGWAGKGNGELLVLMAGTVDVFVTIDRNLVAQQNLTNLPVAVIVLRARSNAFEDVAPLVPEILRVLQSIQRGQVVRLGGETEVTPR